MTKTNSLLTTRSALFWNLIFCFSLALNLISYTTMDVIFAIFALLGIYDSFRRKEHKILEDFHLIPDKFNLLVAAFTVSCVLGYLLGSPMNIKQWEEVAALRWILGFYCCFYAGRRLQNTKGSINLSYPFLAAILVVILIRHKISGTGSFMSPSYRILGFYQNTNHLALAAVLPFSYILGFLAVSKPKSRQFFFLFSTLVLIAIILFATYSRGAWLAALISAIIACIYSRNKKLTYFVGIIIAVIIGFYVLNILEFRDRILYSFDMSAMSSQGQRLAVWKVNWAIFLDHPLFGVGLEESARLYPIYYQKLGLPTELVLGNAHNQFLQMLSGSGLFGLVSYLGMFGCGCIFFHKSFYSTNDTSKKGVSLAGLLVIVALFVSSLADSPFSLQEVRNYVLLLLGFSFGFLYQNSLGEVEVR